MNTELIQKLDSSVIAVLSSDKLIGFQKAYLVAQATSDLKKLLTPEYMKPIMELQGSRLGFKTDKDKDKEKGYGEDIVKNCLIEAVLMGVQPVGNQFNIIAGNMYITKEGYGELLKKIPNLKYDIIFDNIRITPDKQSALVSSIITWSLKSEENKKTLELNIKVNQYMGADAIVGKATRKARKWLFETITGVETSDGDVSDVDYKIVSSKINLPSLEEIKELVEQKKEKLTKTELQRAQEIIDNNETNSFKKLHDTLIAK